MLDNNLSDNKESNDLLRVQEKYPHGGVGNEISTGNSETKNQYLDFPFLGSGADGISSSQISFSRFYFGRKCSTETRRKWGTYLFQKISILWLTVLSFVIVVIT